jgi:hypothetical protein
VPAPEHDHDGDGVFSEYHEGDDPFADEYVRPAWAPLTLVAFVALVVCSNVAGITWAQLLESSPAALLALSSRNRYLVLSLGADVSIVAYWVIATVRIAAAFLVCHLIGRAYRHEALGWFTKYLGVTRESVDGFNRGFAKAEWVVVPFFVGSNIVGALTGIHRTPVPRLIGLLAVGIAARLALMWWLSSLFQEELESFVAWLQRYTWWAIGISIAAVVLVNLRNVRRGAAG